MKTSAIEFATASRIHMGLGVRDLEQSLAFYRVLLGAEPTKIRPGYAKFEPEEPPVNLSLIEGSSDSRPAAGGTHFGVQVKSTDAVESAAGRLREAAIPIRIQEETDCCFSVQTKVWADDPDGNPWEVFVVVEPDSDIRDSMESPCCDDGSC